MPIYLYTMQYIGCWKQGRRCSHLPMWLWMGPSTLGMGIGWARKYVYDKNLQNIQAYTT